LHEIKQEVLLHECPEDLRIAVVGECLEMSHRVPAHDARSIAEHYASLYIDSALARQHVSTSTGPQLTHKEHLAWARLLSTLPPESVPDWPGDPVMAHTRSFYQSNGHLDARKRNLHERTKLSEQEREEDQLARDLVIVRRAKQQDVYDHMRRAGMVRNTRSTLLRRKLSQAAVELWESEFGTAWHWLPGREKGIYIPGSAVIGDRHEWSREPFFCKAVGCYLCGSDFDSKRELVSHWRDEHLDLPPAIKAEICDYQVEETIRSRIFYQEHFNGPYEVRGQEMRRVIGTHATHQTQSVPGSGSMNHNMPLRNAQPRQLGGCVICAREFWTEDLYQLDLFTQPIACEDYSALSSTTQIFPTLPLLCQLTQPDPAPPSPTQPYPVIPSTTQSHPSLTQPFPKQRFGSCENS
jgi:hypothetical protein